MSNKKKDFTITKSFFCFVTSSCSFSIKNAAALIILFQLTPLLSTAVIDFNQRIFDIQSEIFNLHFEKAKKLIYEEKISHPENAATISCEATLDFYQAFLSEKDDDFEKLKDASSARLDLLEDESETSPYYLHLQAELIFQRAIIRAMHSELLSAGLDSRKAYKLFEENHQKFPNFKPSLKGLGLLHIMIGSVPENYRWAVNMVGLKGTIAQGMAELNDLVNESAKNQEQSYLKNETLLILIYIETHYAKNIPNAHQLIKLYDQNYTSQMIAFSIANVYAIDGKNDLMLNLLLNLKSDKSAYPLHYLEYMKGSGLLNKLDYSAAQYLLKFTSGNADKRFVKSAYQKLAWICLLSNDTTGYRTYMNKVLKTESNFTDEDKQAQTEAVNGQRPNINLLKARLLFDGGYYLKSLQQLTATPQKELVSQNDKIEYIYRTARAFDMLDQKSKAITFYTNTIQLSENTTFYYAANSALNIAQIYETQNDKANAILFYRKCLSMRNHEYQNSIDQKAKAGLNRLGVD